MKKRIILILALLVVLLVTLTGCEESGYTYNQLIQIKHGFTPIDEETGLAFANTTKVVYYIFGEHMAPYISINGNFCRYIDSQIVEIIK